MTEPKTAKDALAECREAFERWFSDDYQSMKAIEKNADGNYILQSAYNNWKAWEAAWNTRAQPEQAPADVKELIRKYQHEVDYLEQIERTEFGDDSLSTYSIFLKELKGLSSQPPAVAGDDWETYARRLSCQCLSESSAAWTPEQWYKKMLEAWHGDVKATDLEQPCYYMATPPASDIAGLREAIAEKVLYEDALQYLYDFTGSKPIGSTEYQIHMYIYSIFQSAEKGEFND